MVGSVSTGRLLAGLLGPVPAGGAVPRIGRNGARPEQRFVGSVRSGAGSAVVSSSGASVVRDSSAATARSNQSWAGGSGRSSSAGGSDRSWSVTLGAPRRGGLSLQHDVRRESAPGDRSDRRPLEAGPLRQRGRRHHPGRRRRGRRRCASRSGLRVAGGRGAWRGGPHGGHQPDRGPRADTATRSRALKSVGARPAAVSAAGPVGPAQCPVVLGLRQRQQHPPAGRRRGGRRPAGSQQGRTPLHLALGLLGAPAALARARCARRGRQPGRRRPRRRPRPRARLRRDTSRGDGNRVERSGKAGVPGRGARWASAPRSSRGHGGSGTARCRA